VPEGIPIRVLLVGVHGILLYGLRRLLDEQRPQMCVVASATSCAAAVEAIESAKPDVVVLDANLAQENYAAVVPALISVRNLPVIILSESRDRNAHESAILHGASGIVRLSESPETLIKAIKKVHEGQLWLDRCTTGKLFVELSRRKDPNADPVKCKVASLTTREQEVLRALVTTPGADNKTLAVSLHMCEHTLRNHLSRMYDKLGVPNRMELYVFAQHQGFERRV
jgi:two-component system, NarL family, nitrate/nitrite response regulator NarL